MADVSPHGLAFAGVQLVVVVVVWWLAARWQATRPRSRYGLAVALFAWYAVLRVQPYRMNGTWFAYTLGIFDGITLVGILGLLWTRRVHTVDTAVGP